MSAKTEIPWVYLCLKVQHMCPEAGARLALGLQHAWPANDSLPDARPATAAGERRETAAL